MSRPSIPLWVEFICAQCATPGTGRFVRSLHDKGLKTALITKAKADGWVFELKEAFCSRACLVIYLRRRREIRQAAASPPQATGKPR